MATTFQNDISVLGPDEGVGKSSAENNFKGFNEDLLALPFDLSAPASAFPSLDLSNPIVFPLTSITYDSTPPIFTNFPIVDNELHSPLGLEDSPFSELLASPAFGLVPSPPLGAEDFHALFPPPHSFAPGSSPALSHFNLPSFPPLPPLPSTAADLPFSNTSTPALSPPSHSPPLSTASATRPRATGFRGASTPLLPLDAPIRPREYRVQSSTSKKRKTTAIERGLAKRGRSSSSPDTTVAVAAEKEEGEEIPEDLVEQAERKRLQNTLSARKSRQRKQERLGMLEERNRELESTNEQLRARVEELERVMRSIGAAV